MEERETETQAPAAPGPAVSAPVSGAMPQAAPVRGASLTRGNVLHLQRSIGNAMTTALIARAAVPNAAALEPRTNEQIAKDAIDNNSVQDAKHEKLVSSGYAGVAGADRQKLISILCDQGWIGPFDEWALEALWNSFGPTGIEAAFEADGGASFKKSVDGGANLYEIPAVKAITADFAADTKGRALANLDANQLFIGKEKEKLGITQNPLAPQTAEEGKRRQDERDKYAKELVELGVQAKRAEEAKAKLLATPVGRKYVASQGGGGWVRVNYDPAAKPQAPPDERDAADGARAWEDVDEDFRIVMAVIAGLGARSPSLFAAMSRDKTADMADPATALQAAKESILDTESKIQATRPKISGDLDWRDLQPIHEQLFSGHGKGKRDWSKGLNQAVARSLLEGHENAEFWKTLGLSTLAAAAFIISELATGGMATAFWAGVGIGIGAGQAAASWEKYEDLSTAAGATTSADLELVSKGQADAALIGAILDTVFAAIDVVGAAWGPAKAALKAGRIAEEGAKASGAVALRDLGRLADDAARREIIEKGIQEFGVEGAREAAVVKALDRYGPAQVIEMGGGYDEIVKALGNNSATAKRLMDWRNGIESELKQYMADQLRSTGRRGLPSNDMDMSALGSGATEARERARTWLGGRLGMDPAKVEALIGGQLFTDPRRLHIYEGLPAATRTLIEQQTNRFAIEASQNMRLAEALAHGDEALAKEIREQMAAMGIKETKIAKLSAGERLRLGHEIDELQAKMEEAIAKGEPADEFAKGIGERQGLINANEPGAYRGGGGGRGNVTGRPDDPFPGYAPGEPGAALSGPEKASRMFEEQRMLDEAVAKLEKASKPEDIAGAIKKVGKYGGRQAGTAAEFAGTAELDALTQTFKELQKRAESGAVTAELNAQMSTTIQEAHKALDTLARDVEGNLAKWAQEAGMASGEELSAIQARIIWGMRFKVAVQGAKRQYATLGRMLKLGLDPNVTGVPEMPEPTEK
jgi:hypothetical protein